MTTDHDAENGGYLTGQLLVAMPQMRDPRFARSVIYMCAHNAEGAMGLVVNRPTETRASQIVNLDPPPTHDSRLEVWIGGPVEPERGWLLVANQSGDGFEICPGLFL